MKNQQASEEKLMGELELMYQRVADLEGDQAPDEDHHDPKKTPFPGNSTNSPSWDPPGVSKGRPRPEKKPFSRIYLILASFSVVLLASVSVLVILDLVTGPPGSEKRELREATASIRLNPSPPVQRQENVSQPAEQRQPRTETISQETVESKSPTHQTVELKLPTHKTVAPQSSPPQTVEPEPVFTESMHFAVQVGAFSNWRNASRRIDSLRQKNLEPYWIARQSRSRGIVYVIFSGSFTNRREARQFMEGKDIRKDYPGSFVRGISF